MRVYPDTSVFGGCFEPEFKEASVHFFEIVHEGGFSLVLSDVTLIELDRAPRHVQALLESLPSSVERVIQTEEVENLRDAYLDAGILGRSSHRDAAHIASASVARVELIVSWNFRHIVHFDKIKGYHEVNSANGYPEIPIHTPLEVV